MDLPSILRQRLEQLGHEQRDLAAAAQVTESYISQLLTRKKAPPAPERTDIYGKIEEFLKFRRGELTKLVDLQRQEELKRKLADPPAPLFKEVRELVLRKCRPDQQKQIRTIFERQPFGELELLVTQKLLDVVKGVARQELESERWLRQDASLSAGATEEEIAFLKSLRFRGRHPTPLFYYRELQNLRDPLHFRGPALEEGAVVPTRHARSPSAK